MRKTSHDGADTTSITSGKDNESKKSLSNFNKMKKNSIKRKAPNFSQEADDGIIEPLLQTDQEKIEIANRSAKYLLNKPKTESLHERENRFTDIIVSSAMTTIISPASTNVISTSNIITNNMKENQTSTSCISESAPIHNHMNTNIFSTYDIPPGLITTKNPILIEIEASKCRNSAGTPSPLIFTTAKIHTDSKTKVMEPIQVTPMPILSTIEGSIIKAEVVSNVGMKGSNLPNTSSIALKNVTKTIEKESAKDKIYSPSEAHSLSKSEILNPAKENIKSKSLTTHSLQGSSNVLYTDIKLSRFPNNVKTFVTLPTVSTSIKDDSKTLYGQIATGTVTDTNISVAENIKEPIETSKVSSNKLEITTFTHKPHEKLHTTENKNNSNISQVAIELQNQENIHKTNKKSAETTLVDVKGNADLLKSPKKLQRQKKSSIDETNDLVNMSSKVDTNSLAKELVKKSNVPSDKESKVSSPNALSSLPSAKHPSNSMSIQIPTTTASKLISNRDLASSSKIKSTPESVNLKSTLVDVSADIHNSVNKSDIPAQTSIEDGKESKTTSIKHPHTSPQISSKITPNIGKPDISTEFHSTQYAESNITGPSHKGEIINTTLPSYIVSTSKTKIGLTLTSTTPAITTKAQTQTALFIASTTNESVKTSSSSVDSCTPTSTANSTKQAIHTNQARSKSQSINKDRRA